MQVKNHTVQLIFENDPPRFFPEDLDHKITREDYYQIWRELEKAHKKWTRRTIWIEVFNILLLTALIILAVFLKSTASVVLYALVFVGVAAVIAVAAFFRFNRAYLFYRDVLAKLNGEYRSKGIELTIKSKFPEGVENLIISATSSSDIFSITEGMGNDFYIDFCFLTS